MDKIYMNAMITVSRYVGETTHDWLDIKKELLKHLSADDRKVFSTRDPKTKKHVLNKFEKEIIESWWGLTGIVLKLDPDKTSDGA